MDKITAEAAQTSLEIYSRELSPVYEQARQHLSGLLSSSGAMLDDLRSYNQHARANGELITSFVGSLPIADNSETFTLSDTSEFRLVQSAVLWTARRDHLGWYYITPSYIVGQKHSRDNPDKTNVLIAGAWQSDRSITIATDVDTEKLAESEEYTRRNSLKDLSKEEIETLFSVEDETLHITSRTAGIMALRNREHIGNVTGRLCFRYRHLRRMYGTEAASALSIPTKGSGGTSNDSGTRVGNDTLAEYDVMTHLNDLAILFDKEDVLKGLLMANAIQDDPTGAIEE